MIICTIGDGSRTSTNATRFAARINIAIPELSMNVTREQIERESIRRGLDDRVDVALDLFDAGHVELAHDGDDARARPVRHRLHGRSGVLTI